MGFVLSGCKVPIHKSAIFGWASERISPPDPGYSIMPCNLEFEKAILLLDAGTYIMNHKRNAVPVFSVTDNHDMRPMERDNAGYDIPGPVVPGFVGDFQGPAAPFKIGPEVWHAPVIDVSVRLIQAPPAGVLGKVRLHIFMDEFLKIEVEACAHCPYDDVRANAPADGDVAVRIVQDLIA